MQLNNHLVVNLYTVIFHSTKLFCYSNDFVVNILHTWIIVRVAVPYSTSQCFMHQCMTGIRWQATTRLLAKVNRGWWRTLAFLALSSTSSIIKTCQFAHFLFCELKKTPIYMRSNCATEHCDADEAVVALSLPVERCIYTIQYIHIYAWLPRTSAISL